MPAMKFMILLLEQLRHCPKGIEPHVVIDRICGNRRQYAHRHLMRDTPHASKWST
jgi:hypothetical protein